MRDAVEAMATDELLFKVEGDSLDEGLEEGEAGGSSRGMT